MPTHNIPFSQSVFVDSWVRGEKIKEDSSLTITGSFAKIRKSDINYALRHLSERSMQYPPRASIDLFQNKRKVGTLAFQLPTYTQRTNEGVEPTSELAPSNYHSVDPDFFYTLIDQNALPSDMSPSNKDEKFHGPHCYPDPFWKDKLDVLKTSIEFAIEEISQSKYIEPDSRMRKRKRAFFEGVTQPFEMSYRVGQLTIPLTDARGEFDWKRMHSWKKIGNRTKIELGWGDVLNALHTLLNEGGDPHSCALIQMRSFQISPSSSIEIIPIPAVEGIVYAQPPVPYPTDDQWRTIVDSVFINHALMMGRNAIRDTRGLTNIPQGGEVVPIMGTNGDGDGNAFSYTTPVLDVKYHIRFRVRVDIPIKGAVTAQDLDGALKRMGQDRPKYDDRYWFTGHRPFQPSIDLVKKGWKVGSVRFLYEKRYPSQTLTW